MSTENPSPTTTNEDIINDLTKDLESQFTVNDDQKVTTPREIIPDAEIPEDFDDSDSESKPKPPVIPDDFVDEEALKDLELTLTDEEKLARHQEALELKRRGNDEFKAGKHLESVGTYTEALRLCPLEFSSDRSVFYCNRAASKIKLERNQSAIDDCTKAIELNASYVRAYLRRGKLYEDTDKLDESLADYKKVLELDPGNNEANTASVRLPPLINERNEKLKTEMLGKLKDLGNMFLRPFGLSTDNFQMQQDPNSGGYSVNFQQNPNGT